MKRRIVLLVVCALLVSVPAYGTAADFFRIGMSARLLGMGKATVSSAIDSNGVLTNPAILGYVTKPEISSMYSKLSGDVDFICIAGVMPDEATGTKGLGMINFGLGGFFTTERDPITGRIVPGSTFDYRSQIFLFSYGKKVMPELSLGASADLYTESFSGTSGGDASGYGLTLGLLYYPSDTLRMGLLTRNAVNSGMQWSTGFLAELPVVTRAGLSYYPIDPLMTAIEAEFRDNYPVLGSFGLEWSPMGPLFQLRGGVFQSAKSPTETAANITGGVGFSVDGVSFDYAYCHDAELDYNSSHFFSINLGDRLMVRRDAEPPARPEVIEPKVAEPEPAVTPEAAATPEAVTETPEEEVKEAPAADPKAVARLRVLRTQHSATIAYVKQLNNKMEEAESEGDRGRVSRIKALIEAEARKLVNLEQQIRHLERN